MGWTSEKMSRVERGAYRVYEDDVHALAVHYGVTDEVAVGEVVQISSWVPDNAWWLPYEKRLNPIAVDGFWLQSQAETIISYHPTLPPNVLQEPDYIRKLRSAATPEHQALFSDDDFVSVRLGARSVLFRQDRLKTYTALVPEIALDVRDLFGTDVTKRQLNGLLNPPHHPGLQVCVVPTASIGHSLRGGAATILSFRHPWPDAAIIDSPPVVAPVVGPHQVDVVREWLAPVVDSALSPEESREVISDYLARCG
jgi:hypothetical protein